MNFWIKQKISKISENISIKQAKSLNIIRYLKISMATKQINLKLNENLFQAAQRYISNFGFRNIQELATESIREKIFERNQYDTFLNKIQKQKMKELWDNKEDEAWENA